MVGWGKDDAWGVGIFLWGRKIINGKWGWEQCGMGSWGLYMV